MNFPGLILGQSLGRWGNFMDQQAHGGPTTRVALENMHLPNFIVNQMLINGTYYIPTFRKFTRLSVRRIKPVKSQTDGRRELFMSYVIWYSLGRSYIEGLRTGSLMLGPLRVSQWLAVVLIIFGVGLILFWRVKKEKLPYYLDA